MEDLTPEQQAALDELSERGARRNYHFLVILRAKFPDIIEELTDDLAATMAFTTFALAMELVGKFMAEGNDGEILPEVILESAELNRALDGFALLAIQASQNEIELNKIQIRKN